MLVLSYTLFSSGIWQQSPASTQLPVHIQDGCYVHISQIHVVQDEKVKVLSVRGSADTVTGFMSVQVLVCLTIISSTMKAIVSARVKRKLIVCQFSAKSIFIVWSPGEPSYSWAIKTLGFNYLTLWKCIPVGGSFIYSTANQRLETWLLISLTWHLKTLCVCVGGGGTGGSSRSKQGGLWVEMFDASPHHEWLGVIMAVPAGRWGASRRHLISAVSLINMKVRTVWKKKKKRAVCLFIPALPASSL